MILEQESIRKRAKRFRVSDYFVYRLKQRYREAGTIESSFLAVRLRTLLPSG
jgi:transposase